MTLWAHLATLYHVYGCRTFEDGSAICGMFGWGVPW